MADRIRVLYVDDHKGSLDSMRDSLQTDYGFDVITAASVDAATGRVEAGSIDCVVDSLDRTENDGFGLLERVSADHPDLPIILLTRHNPGREPEESVRRAFERGATDSIPRTLISNSDELLAQRIELAVGRSREPDGEPNPFGSDQFPSDSSLVDTSGFQWVDGFVRTDRDSTDVLDLINDEIDAAEDGVDLTEDGIVVTDDGAVYEYVRSVLDRWDMTGEDLSSEPGGGASPFSDGAPGGSVDTERSPRSPASSDDTGSSADDAVWRYAESSVTSEQEESPGDPVFGAVASAVVSNGGSSREVLSDSSVASTAETGEKPDDADTKSTDAGTQSDDSEDSLVDLGEVPVAGLDELAADDDLWAIIEEIRSGNGSVDPDRKDGPTADERVDHEEGPFADSTDDDGHKREDGTAMSSVSGPTSAMGAGTTESIAAESVTSATETAAPATETAITESNERDASTTEPTAGDAGSWGSSYADQPAIEGPDTVQASAGSETASAGGEMESAGSELKGWGTAGAYRRPAGFDPEPGESVLIQCGSHDDREHAACFDLLGGRRTTGTHVMMVRYREMNGTGLERIAASAERVTLVSVGYVQPVPEAVRDVVETVKINNPNDVTRLGIIVTGTVNSWKGTADGIVVCVHPLNVLLQYKSPQSVFRFLHIFLGKLRSAGAISHFHVDPTAGDPQDVNTLKPLFDSVLTIDSVGVHLENT